MAPTLPGGSPGLARADAEALIRDHGARPIGLGSASVT
jgi:hypothetical protein